MNKISYVSLLLYLYYKCSLDFLSKQAAGRMPAACPCNHMFTAGINRNHNNLASLPPFLIVCYSCCCLFGTGCLARSSRVMIHFHTYILLCRISFFSGLRLRMPVDRPCNRMFTAGISRSHNNCTSLPPSLIVCYSCRSLRDGMSVRIIPSHDILSCQYSIMSNFSFNRLQTRMSADRSCNRMFTVGISRNHDNCTSLPPSFKFDLAARRLLFSWENVRKADQLES